MLLACDGPVFRSIDDVLNVNVGQVAENFAQSPNLTGSVNSLINRRLLPAVFVPPLYAFAAATVAH